MSEHANDHANHHDHHGGHSGSENEPGLFGILSEYETADGLIAATKKAKAEGYEFMDGYSPFAVGDVADAMGYKRSEMAPVMFFGGLIGCLAGFCMQWYLSAYDYPVNIGGRPYLSWPSFIVITFEMTILTTGLSGVFGLIALCGLPQPHHPLFGVPQFDRASRDRFFLCIEAEDPKFDAHKTMEFLQSTNAVSVVEVPLT